MKNTIKMSLVAAVAVAGLTSNVAAKPLEEAIKNVDVSGSVVYRYNDYQNDGKLAPADSSTDKADKTDNNYKIAVSLKSKVNDYVTATVRVVTGHDLTATNQQTRNSSFSTLETGDNFDANPTLQVSQANFTVKTDYATVIAGKQGLTTPWTVAIDSDGNEQTGTGLLALVPAGPVTVAAAYFNQTNLDNVVGTGTENISTVGVLGSAGPVSFDAWYLDMDDTFDSYTVGAKATIDMITAELRYASLELDNKNAQGETDNSIVIAKVGAKMDAFSAYLQYGMTDKDGGLTALDADAKTTMIGWNTNIHDKRDADYLRVGAGMDVMSGLNVSLNYADLEYKDAADDKVEESELYTQLTHKMGTNLVTYVRYGIFDQDTKAGETVDATAGRLQIEYKF
eukprot:gnl/Dysnectes_brevis/5281_a7527_507.p1 GENE.gnl/Dysnectes_brevis/5281_a7527_507~~gnl/Dysnectes_brevis/5281_a7527_507.p1  ORF type:complete len:396 (-),score=-42.94 gnl/Dysnectes_brevis/5281_a7527_507:112-1299(-)